MKDVLSRTKAYLDSWNFHPAKTLGPQPTEFIRSLIIELGGVWPRWYPQELGEEATTEAHALLKALYVDELA